MLNLMVCDLRLCAGIKMSGQMNGLEVQMNEPNLQNGHEGGA
jgi:hypothetical protein